MTPHKYIVGTADDAHFHCLADALKDAVHGDLVLLQPGLHELTAAVDQNVTLASVRADSPTGGPDTGEDDMPATLVSPLIEGNVKLMNLHIKGRVDIQKGHVVIEECDIYDGSDGVRVRGDCRLTLKSSRVHRCNAGGAGVYFMKGSAGEVENTDLYECRVSGIHVDGANVILRNNRIRDSSFGIYLRRKASGLVESNSVEHIKNFGIFVTEESDPVVRSNTVQQCGIQCAYVSKGASGIWTDNTFEGSVHVLPNCNTKFMENRITNYADIDTS